MTQSLNNYLPQRFYEKFDQSLKFIPGELLSLELTCSNKNCGESFKPNWLKKRPPLEPVSPNKGKGQWRPYSATIECPSCNSNVQLKLPYKKQEAIYYFYGDEAYRNIDDKFLITYSLVGTNRSWVNDTNQKINSFKKQLVPDREPEDWQLHLKDIWAYHSRQKHEIFSNWDKEFVNAFIDDYFDLFEDFSDHFTIFNVSAIYHKSSNKKERRKQRKEIRQISYSSLLMMLINICTAQGINPRIILDTDKDTEANRVIHEWAQEAFFGSKLNLVYPFITRGIKIQEPRFVQPASHPCLELADFVSYVVARYIFRKLKGREVDLDPKRFGKITYVGFSSGGNKLDRKYTSGYPWEFFYNKKP